MKTTAKSSLLKNKVELRGGARKIKAPVKTEKMNEKDLKEGRLVKVKLKTLHKYHFDKCHRCENRLTWRDWRGDWITPETFVAHGYHCEVCNKTYVNETHKGTLSRFDMSELRGLRTPTEGY